MSLSHGPGQSLLDRLGLRSRWAWISLATLIYWTAPQSIRLFYPLQMQHRGASDLVIGLAVAGSSVAGLVLAVPSGYLLDRFDSQLVLVVSTFGLAVTVGAFVLTTSVLAMAVLMFVQGLFQMWAWLVLQEMITRVGTGPRAEQQLSLFSLAWGVGMAAGPSVMAALYDHSSFGTLNVTCFGMVLIATVAACFVPSSLRATAPSTQADGPAERPGIVVALRESFSNAAVVGVMASSFVNIFVQSLRTSFYSLYLEDHGVSITMIGALLSCIGVSSLAVRLVLRRLVRRHGFVRPLIWSTWIAIFGVAMTPISQNTAFLVVGALMIGSGLGANPPITVQLLAGRETGNRGTAVGLRMLANRTAQVIQPLVFGTLSATIGLAAAFPVAGVMLGGAAVWMARRLAPLRGVGRVVVAVGPDQPELNPE
ncbi:MAG TPA: MFS transporter [Marmoricola sp.]|nr:MFS transporter [Marmoricola sp.]